MSYPYRTAMLAAALLAPGDETVPCEKVAFRNPLELDPVPVEPKVITADVREARRARKAAKKAEASRRSAQRANAHRFRKGHSNRKLKRFWASWYGTHCPRKAWVTGSVGLTGNELTICAIVDAPSPEVVEWWCRVRRGYTRDRFVSEKEAGWTPGTDSPGDRFRGPYPVFRVEGFMGERRS